MNRRARAILWIDSVGGCAAGVIVLSIHDWLSALYEFPLSLVLLFGAANLGYGTYSGTLATLAALGRTPGRKAIEALISANLAWTLVCITVLATHWHSASPFGLLHAAVEGAYVAALAVIEWRRVRPAAR
jgi:hypothetical protein